MAAELWIAVGRDHLHVMEHEGDYEEGDTLLAIKPGMAIGAEIRIVPPSQGVSK